MRAWILTVVVTLSISGAAEPADFVFKDRLVDELVEKVPAILKTFDAETGRFGSGIWICGDQQAMYPLAVAYATAGDDNPYYRDAELLKVIVKSGDPLLENMDDRGRWIFQKKDGSTWGMIPHLDELLETAGGVKANVGADPIALSPEQVAGWVAYAGYRLRLPESASLRWPVLPHNPYRKDGRATPPEGRIVIHIPFDQVRREHRVAIEILGR